ncbi:aminotransferase class I/II-fold pyridoxal phosphate-dependent enzyme [Neorhizobium sp. T786]|uniref:aminotransferase class I/II-fold pyridoxal phosphate-dependent enzyme n=1 Tax=Pseudorhizobium xiangyangii TaxID=2883104 RepID=UPI001CFFEA54|nr:aminotransferase class I/II-fold pyridoxal phosphate-dependent enzyme [Neorhizobium xiangyangii]MCB5203503.1 aminotransferase class I/II-fold pyridoxal phosphate-dependent enzyme [Neorhizobium xiangyangii]
MPVTTVSSRMLAVTEEMRTVMDYARKVLEGDGLGPDACDFMFGNPQEMPLRGLVDALVRHTEPQDVHWFGYQKYNDLARETVARRLSEARGRSYEPADIAITAGGFGAIAAALLAVLEVGEEVIYPRPGWFAYGAQIRGAAGTPVAVDLAPETYDLDLERIEAAITRRTRVVVVNTPHNPTGRIFPRAQLDALADVLVAASERFGKVIYLLADEPYARLVFDGNAHVSPAESYPHTLIAYSFGKTLLAPGERLGWLALGADMPEGDRVKLREAVDMAQVSHGWAFAGRTLQRALPDLEKLSIDVAALARRRDRMIEGLRVAGYDLPVPQGTFYIIPRSPIPDDMAFAARLATDGVWVLPGSVAQLPGRLRISLTANDDMVERSLPVFTRAIREVAA